MSTLYIVERGASIKVKHQQFQIYCQQKLLFKVPVKEIDNIILIGYCHLSHGVVQTALFRDLPIAYYSAQGYFQGSLRSKFQPQVDYTKEQVLKAENVSLVREQAEIIVRSKLHNSRILLMRINRRRPNDVTQKAIRELKKIINCLNTSLSLESLRGYEGKGASIYFQGLGALFQGEIKFAGRSSRPPKDPVNSLLGFGYTLLCQHLTSVVQLEGLHTDFGNLHSPRNNHPALVLDLMEEFRAQIVDSLVIYLVNKKIFTRADFTQPDLKAGVYLKRDLIKIFLKHWSEKLALELTHPQTQRKVSLKRCIELQVKDYTAYLMGKQENYQPMIWSK